MKTLLTILLATFAFNSAHAIWAGPNDDEDCFGDGLKKVSEKIIIKRVCGTIITNGFSGEPFVETPQGEFIKITGLYPEVYPYAEGCVYGKVKGERGMRVIHASRYTFSN